MLSTLAFDVYGTLIDTSGVVSKLRSLVGDKAEAFSRSWREKQLEYSFRRGLMRQYENFAVCTRDALDYTCSFFRTALSTKQKDDLLSVYRTLPSFDDVAPSLSALENSHHRLFAFSNGTADAVSTLLEAAGIRKHFLEVVSVDDLKTFKPNPDVYRYFLQKSGATDGNAWLISSNPFDVIGAISAGMKAVWVQRSPEAVFDPWRIEPTLVIKSLRDLNEALHSAQQQGG